MPQAVSLVPFLLALMGYAFAGLTIWPSFHIALSNSSVFVDFSKPNSSTISNMSLSLVNMETNTTILIRTLPSNLLACRVEFNCSCFLYAGTFRFLLKQTSITTTSQGNETDGIRTESTTWWWSSELQVQWPTFHIAVERAGNHSGSFQVGISTNEHFQGCTSGIDSALSLEVSHMEYNQIGRNTIDKVRARTQRPFTPLRSQSVELFCAFPFTERDFIRVALRSPHTAQEVKSSGPLYLSRIFSYKLLVENANAYKNGCEGTMTVKMISPPCAHVSGKVLLYSDPGIGRGVAFSSSVMGLGPEEPSTPPLAYNWLTQGDNKTEFNCSVFYPGRNKYCFRFVFNSSRSPSPAQTCLVVYRSAESWGPWQPWSVCSVSCGEGVRERVRECLLPSGVRGMQCTGMVKEQSICSLEDCVESSTTTPSLPPESARAIPLGGNMIVVVGISLCLAVIMVTVVVTVWRKLCHTPQCSSVRRSSIHSPGGRKLSDEASIFGHSLQRSDGHGPSGCMVANKNRPTPGTSPLSQTLVLPVSQDPERLSPTGQKVLPTIFGYRLAQQQLKEMKKKGLKEATQVYHVSSSPVHDTMMETPASPTNSPIATPADLAHATLPLSLQDADNHHFCIATPLSKLQTQTSRVTPDRLSPRVELALGPPVSAHANVERSKWHDRTADWVEMVERSRLAGLGGRGDAPTGTGLGGRGDAPTGTAYHKNPNFRRTSSFNDTRLLQTSSAQPRQFRERSMTQVGSRTLPEGSCWNKGGWERLAHPSYPIPEHGVSEWAKARPQRNDQKKPWTETQLSSHNYEIKHAGTNTNCFSSAAKQINADLDGTVERKRACESTGGVGQSVSGIGGPATGPGRSHGVSQLSVDRAEQNWNRRGPSPIQRNILARKLKEAQSCSGAKGRKRSSSFNVSVSEQRKGNCRSLPMSGEYSSNGSSPFRLSEAEQRMLDLDLSTAYVQVDE